MIESKEKVNFTPQILKSIFGLIALKGWGVLSLADFAGHLDMSLDEFKQYVISKEEILQALFAYIDTQAIENIESESADLSLKESLFDVLMARFEVLNEYKPAIRLMWEESCQDPGLVVTAVPIGAHSLDVMWDKSTQGMDIACDLLMKKGFTALYLSLVPVWLNDESEDLSVTMAELDKRIEKCLSAYAWFAKNQVIQSWMGIKPTRF